MSGALDSFKGNRNQKFSAVDDAIKYGQQMQSETNRNQVDMFGSAGMEEELIKVPSLKDIPNWSEKDSLAKEKEVLGFYVSGHPLLEHSEDLEEFTSISFEEQNNINNKDMVVIGGMITRIVRRFDKRNREMAFFDLDCLGGHAEVIAFSDCFKSFGNFIEEESVVFIKGKLSDGSDFSDLKIISDEIIPVKQVRDRLSQRLNIKFSSGQVEGEDVEELMYLARKNQGNCRLIFHLPNQGSIKPLKIIAHNIMVTTDSLFIKNLRTKYGKENVWVD
tara:strand:- start:172 stop:999 length:828 start_codon:yes stop_codon:yes gene_type:complete